MRWIKSEPSTRIWVDGDVCYKHYLVPFHLRFRTFGQRSRARRERANLERLGRMGVATLDVIAVHERRAFGFVIDSTIATTWVAGATSLEHWFARGKPCGHIELSRELGRTLARMHAGGLVSNSASPRNWLVATGPDERLVPMVIDQVHVADLASDVRGSSAAIVDLAQLLGRRPERLRSTVGFRYRVLLAYCDGDRTAARRLWRRISGGGRWRTKLRRWASVVRSRLGVRFRG